MLKWSHLIGIRSKLWRSQSRVHTTCVEKCYRFTCWLGGLECCEEREQRSSVCYRHPALPLLLSAHLSRETSLTISQCSRSANAGFYKRCSARQQGVSCLRLMSTQMQADSSGINNLISLDLFLLSSPCFFFFSRLWRLIKETTSWNVCLLLITL